MLSQGLIQELAATETFFLNTIAPLTSEDGPFKPSPDMYSITGQLHHVATTITWFIDGAFRTSDGFAMDFENHIAASQAATDFDAAKQMVIDAFADARAVIEAQDDASLTAALPEGPIMGGAPKLCVVSGIVDHTAHHRGALTVYARLLGKVAPMPYA